MKNFRSHIIDFTVHRLALPVVKLFVPDDYLPVATESLASYPEGSLGRGLVSFLRENGLSRVPHFESHDIKHVLLGYTISGKDECCMQFFYLGNRHYSSATILTSFCSLFLLPEHTGAFIRAFRRGRKTKPIGKIKLAELLGENVPELRKRFGIPELIRK